MVSVFIAPAPRVVVGVLWTIPAKISAAAAADRTGDDMQFIRRLGKLGSIFVPYVYGAGARTFRMCGRDDDCGCEDVRFIGR
jgi:hypothetical protein